LRMKRMKGSQLPLSTVAQEKVDEPKQRNKAFGHMFIA